MELRVLRYFLAVAREGTIVRAAEFLHVTQPTLSRQLQELEDELGQQLFIRSNRNITLTPEGMFLRKRAEEIVEMVKRTEADFSAMGNFISGKVYIGGGETNAMMLIAEIIRELRGIYPEIKYHIFSGNAADVMERLDKGIWISASSSSRSIFPSMIMLRFRLKISGAWSCGKTIRWRRKKN